MTLSELPKPIQNHLLNLIQTSELPDTEEFRDRLAAAWEKKSRLFTQQCKYLDMELMDSFPKDDKRGLIVLTFSGSIVAIFPEDESREVEYASIHLRSDVPKSVSMESTKLAEDVKPGSAVCFTSGKLQKTSAAYLIAVCPENLDPEVQKDRIREAMIYLTNGFMKINQTIYMEKKNIPDHFTSKSMCRYIAKRNNITGAQAQQIIDDYTLLIETGMLLGENVPLGKIGRLSLKTREAQKARIIKHPETGEEITVKAKPATSVPKISFSKHIKEKAAALPLDEPVEE